MGPWELVYGPDHKSLLSHTCSLFSAAPNMSANFQQLIRLFITVFTLTPPKVYTDPLQPIRPNNYITESPPNWHIYCHAELHSMDLQSIDLHADIQVFI